MLFTHLKRIIRTGFINFWRNGFLSFSAIVVITLSLSVFGALIFGSAFGRALLKEVKNKVDINVYFTLDAQETDIVSLKKTIENLPEVDKVEYISRDQALSDFKDKWKDNTLILQGLDEIGDNPFPAVLNIKAKEPSQYAGIARFLESKNNSSSKDGVSILEKVNYNQNKLIIDRLGRIIPAIEKVGSVISIILILVALIITFNTIRLIIFTSKDEISVMKLVGASNIYIRGPYFIQNITQISLIILISGIILGGISSYLAVKRYLKV